MRKKAWVLVGILIIASLLRFYKLDTLPVSMFGDELDVGYHAYSISKTGKDYSGNFWPLHFQSLAEWRTPLYLYAAVPTVSIFGVSPLGVRLPAAIFGVLSIYSFYLLLKILFKKENTALLGTLVLSLSPWHIQYSRAGFEVTQLLFFLILGLYFFFYSLENKGKRLWMATACFALMPWVYSTAKLFTPFLLVVLGLLYSSKIVKFSKKTIILALISLAVIGGPIAHSTVFGGGAERFGYISIFSDPTTEPEIGTARLTDARARGEIKEGLSPTIIDKLFHNKFSFWTETISRNYFQALSADFLFFKGDPNLRHSINKMGQFYQIEILALILGFVLFVVSKEQMRKKLLILFWIVGGIFPATLTRDGGHHATRLILILPPIVILISFGLAEGFNKLKQYKLAIPVSLIYSFVLFINIIFYQHQFWVHNPFESERWWHYGFEESIKSIKEIDKDYDKVIISTANEPPWIFFAGWYEYNPAIWHQNYPLKKTTVEGLGEVSYIDKFYFGAFPTELYSWGRSMDTKTLYLATEKEVKINLVKEPERTPPDLKLIKSVVYPSGEPAFYLFTKK